MCVCVCAGGGVSCKLVSLKRHVLRTSSEICAEPVGINDSAVVKSNPAVKEMKCEMSLSSSIAGHQSFQLERQF